MNVYAESSAVLSWLLDEPSADRVADILGQATIVVASDLTLVECERALVRRVALHQVSEAEAADDRARLTRAATHWTLLPIHPTVLERARRAFPVEPVRTLDAVHLASAVVARGALGEVTLLALDERVRRNAEMLGFAVVP